MKTLTIIGLLGAACLPALPARAGDTAESWAQHCAACHGLDGSQTRIGRKLGAKDLTDPAYQKTFTDDQLFAHLKNGETGADGKVKMKPYGDQLTDGELKDLVAYVRSLAK